MAKNEEEKHIITRGIQGLGQIAREDIPDWKPQRVTDVEWRKHFKNLPKYPAASDIHQKP